MLPLYMSLHAIMSNSSWYQLTGRTDPSGRTVEPSPMSRLIASRAKPDACERPARMKSPDSKLHPSLNSIFFSFARQKEAPDKSDLSNEILERCDHSKLVHVRSESSNRDHSNSVFPSQATRRSECSTRRNLATASLKFADLRRAFRKVISASEQSLKSAFSKFASLKCARSRCAPLNRAFEKSPASIRARCKFAPDRSSVQLFSFSISR